MAEGSDQNSEKQKALVDLNTKLDNLLIDIRNYYENYYPDDKSKQGINLIVKRGGKPPDPEHITAEVEEMQLKSRPPIPEQISPDVSDLQFEDPNL